MHARPSVPAAAAVPMGDGGLAGARSRRSRSPQHKKLALRRCPVPAMVGAACGASLRPACHLRVRREPGPLLPGPACDPSRDGQLPEAGVPAQPGPIPRGFADTGGNTHESAIDALAAAGITTGCSTSPARFCPDVPVTRGRDGVAVGSGVAVQCHHHLALRRRLVFVGRRNRPSRRGVLPAEPALGRSGRIGCAQAAGMGHSPYPRGLRGRSGRGHVQLPAAGSEPGVDVGGTHRGAPRAPAGGHRRTVAGRQRRRLRGGGAGLRAVHPGDRAVPGVPVGGTGCRPGSTTS